MEACLRRSASSPGQKMLTSELQLGDVLTESSVRRCLLSGANGTLEDPREGRPTARRHRKGGPADASGHPPRSLGLMRRGRPDAQG